MLNNLTSPHEYPGKLFVVEGIDGSGKTTQLGLLAKWLSAEGHRVFVTEWNSSALVKAATKTGKKKNALTPMTFSLLHATDFADRLLYKIIPPLKAGMIVLADRYAYTAFARDATRGVERQWVRDLYGFAVKPDLAMYFRVPIDVSLDRLMARRVKLKFYEAGMDLGWSTNPAESFRLFQGKVLDEYDLILCDCAPNLMTGTQNALYASDWYCIPMQPDFLSSIGLGLLQDRLGYLKNELEFKIRCLGVVFTRVRHWLRYHSETMERLREEKEFKRLHFFDAFIPENIKLAEAPMESKPIALHDASASGAEAFKTLTAEFLRRLEK